MPQTPDLSELWRVVRAMESALNGHLQGCGEQNRARDRWEQDRRDFERKSDANMTAVCKQVAALQRARAHSAGFNAGLTAVGIVVGSIISAILTALLPKLIG